MKLSSLLIIVVLLAACNMSQHDDGSINQEGNTLKYKNIKMIINEDTLNRDDVFAIIEPLWWSVSIYEGEKQYYEDLKSFSDPQKFVFAIQWYLSEVNNGGHDQFYYNSTGIVWEEALAGFKIVGLDVCFDILQQSVKLMGGKPIKDREKRQDQLEKYEPDFELLDNRLYEIEDIEEKLLEYIRSNKKDFLFSGVVDIPE